MDNTNQPRVEDVLPVRSRVSWQAVFAGAVIAVAMYVVLVMLGSAVGVSLSDTDIRNRTLGIAAAAWLVISLIASLFVGGFITTQCSVGENRQEAVVHGVLTWAAVVLIMTVMTTTALRGGYGALMGAATLSRTVTDPANTDWEAVARRAGIPQDRIDAWREQARNLPNRAREEAEDTDNQQAALNTAKAATWWGLVGLIVSIASAVGGAVAGSGPTFRFFVLQGRTRVMINRGEQLAHR
jgi:hypothetical protein